MNPLCAFMHSKFEALSAEICDLEHANSPQDTWREFAGELNASGAAAAAKQTPRSG